MNYPKLKAVAVAAITAAAAAGMATGSAGAATIKLETYAGPKHAMNTTAWPTWIKQMEAASKGGIKVNMSYPPINPRDLYDRVREGIADMAWITHGYTTGRFVLTDMAELPGADGNAEQISKAYWRTYTKHFASKNEHKGVVLLALFTHGPGMMHTRKAVPDLAAISGLKIRTGGGVQSQIAKRLNLVSVSAPVTKAQEILERGVADGIFFSLETITSFRLGGVVKFHYSLPGGLYNASFAVIMNQRKYDSLTAAEKAQTKSVTGEKLSGLIGATWDAADKISYDALTKAGGHTIKDFDPPIATAIKKKLADLDSVWIAEAKKEGIADPAAVLKEFRQEVQKIKAGK